jgi:hypothetical protein
MSRRPARFTEADLNRATKVAEARGLEVVVEPDGSIRLARPRNGLLDAAETAIFAPERRIVL